MKIKFFSRILPFFRYLIAGYKNLRQFVSVYYEHWSYKEVEYWTDENKAVFHMNGVRDFMKAAKLWQMPFTLFSDKAMLKWSINKWELLPSDVLDIKFNLYSHDVKALTNGFCCPLCIVYSGKHANNRESISTLCINELGKMCPLVKMRSVRCDVMQEGMKYDDRFQTRAHAPYGAWSWANNPLYMIRLLKEALRVEEELIGWFERLKWRVIFWIAHLRAWMVTLYLEQSLPDIAPEIDLPNKHTNEIVTILDDMEVTDERVRWSETQDKD